MAKNTNTAEDTTENSGVAFEDNAESYTFNMKETEEDSGFAPIPRGTYAVTVEDVQFQMSKSSGKPMWNIRYAISEGEFAEKNRKLFDIISLQESQRGRVKQFINRVAPELADLENFDPKAIAENGTLIGKQLRVKVDIEKDDTYGERNRVRDRLPAGGATGGSFNMG